MLTSKQLNELSALPFELAINTTVTDLAAVPIDRRLPKENRIVRFIEEAGNPYCFKVGGSFVRTCFSPSGPTLQKALTNSVRQA